MSQALQKLATAGFSLLALWLLVFLLSFLIPIDPTLAFLGDRTNQSSVVEVEKRLGLHQTVLEQLIKGAKGIITLDLGVSSLSRRPVLEELLMVFPSTIQLSLTALMIGGVGGVLVGVLSGWKRKGFWDVCHKVLIAIYAAPTFLVALLSLLVFYAYLGWAPPPGVLELSEEKSFRESFSHLILPASVLGVMTMASLSRFSRSFIIEELSKPYMMTALMKGLSPFQAIYRHALRNIFLPLITVLAMTLSHTLEGAVIIETIFARPGLGLYLVHSVLNMDRNALLGGTLFIGVSFIGLNMLIDIFTQWIDPRVRK